jgi:hypothetical protein
LCTLLRVLATRSLSSGQEGTTARAWSANDIVANMLTAGSLAIMAQYNTLIFKTPHLAD